MNLESDRLSIVGGRSLEGNVATAGNKHSMVVAIAAAMATGTVLTLQNVPDVTETKVLRQLLTGLGACVTGAPPVIRVGGRMWTGRIDPVLSKKIHGSCYLLAAVLASRGEVIFAGAGGDSLGNFDWGLPRPLLHMLEVMGEFGVVWERLRGGEIAAKVSSLTGATVDIMRWSSDREVLNGPRVSGATKTALLMAAAASGETVISNPHVQGATIELVRIVQSMGCDIEMTDKRWVISPRCGPGCATYRLDADPVEVIFWQSLAVLTGSQFRVDVHNTAATRMTLRHELEALAGIGITPRFDGDTMITALPPGPYAGQKLVAQSTGISTDILPYLVCLMFSAKTPSSAIDKVWEGRFQYANELRKLGLTSSVRNGVLSVTPAAPRPTTRWLRPADTRSTASCVLFGLATAGQTRIEGAHHVYRGHDRFLEKLIGVGAQVAPL